MDPAVYLQAPLLPIPGVRPADDELGDSRRCRYTRGSNFHGAWTNDPRYYQRHEDDVLELRIVWWLEVEAVIRNVPCGGP